MKGCSLSFSLSLEYQCMCEYWLFHTELGQNLKSDPLNMMAEYDEKIQYWHFYICVCICVCVVKQKMICTDSVWPLRVCAMHGRPQWKQLLQHNHKPHSQAPLPTHFADDILIISQNLHTHSPLCRHVSGRSHERACHFAKCVKVWDGFQRPMLMDIWALKCVHVLHKPQTCMCRCKCINECGLCGYAMCRGSFWPLV